MSTIGIIGMGSLGESLALMLLSDTNVKHTICGSVRRQERLDVLFKTFDTSINFTLNNCQIAKLENCTCIILCVKPGQLKNVCTEIRDVLPSNVPIISTVAAVSLDKLHEWLPNSKNIIRCMPNIPCQIGKGIVPYYVQENHILCEKIMLHIFGNNKCMLMNSDTEIDSCTLISGCGPAFFAWYSDLLKQMGSSSIETNKLMELIAQTMRGTADMLEISSSKNIISAVACKGGATEAALQSFIDNHVDTEIIVGLTTSQRRIETLASEL